MNLLFFILKLVLLPFILVAALCVSVVQSFVRIFHVIFRKKYKKTGKTVVFTGGRSPATLELCRLFHQKGHRVVVIETFHLHLCRYTRAVSKNYRVTAPTKSADEFIEQVADVLFKEKADLLIGTCEEIFYLSKGKARLQERAPQCQIFVENIDVLRTLHDKWEFAQMVIRKNEMGGLQIAPPVTTLITNEEEMRKAIESGDVILKPAYSRFGQSIVVLPKSMEDKKVKHAIEKLKEGADYICQQFVKGQQICTYSVVKDGKLQAHCVYGTEFTPKGKQGASLVWEPIKRPIIDQCIESLMQILNISGQYAFDFMETEDGHLYIIECNPRVTSGIHLFWKQPEIVDRFFQHSEGTLFPDKQRPNYIASALLIMNYLRKSGPSNWKELKRWIGVFIIGRDVIWDATDPMPLITQYVGETWLMLKGKVHGINSIEATSADIEWNGK